MSGFCKGRFLNSKVNYGGKRGWRAQCFTQLGVSENKMGKSLCAILNVGKEHGYDKCFFPPMVHSLLVQVSPSLEDG